MKLVASLFVVVSAALLIAGCGGGDSDSDTTVTTSSLNKAQFLKRAQAICAKGTSPILGEIVKYEERAEKKGEKEVSGAAVKAVIPAALQSEIDEIRGLGAPKGDEEQVEAFLIALQEDVDGLKSGPPLEELEELDSKFRRSGKLAAQYGLDACSYG